MFKRENTVYNVKVLLTKKKVAECCIYTVFYSYYLEPHKDKDD